MSIREILLRVSFHKIGSAWNDHGSRSEALPVSTVNSKRTEARLITAEYCFSHWVVVRAPDSDGTGNAHARNELYLFNGALHNVLGVLRGVHWCASMPVDWAFGGTVWSGLSFHRSAY